MPGILNRSVAKDGVIAYQDKADPTKFHYLPARVDPVLGETLRQFNVTYYGVSEKPYFVHISGDSATSKSVSGGVMSGTAVPDITEKQRQSIIEEIGKVYRVNSPSLVPVVLENIVVEPLYAANIVEMGGGQSVKFPTQTQFGQQFAYNVGSGNSLFAEMVARTQAGGQPDANADFAVNIKGTIKLTGAPWKARIKADLSQVWEYTRTQIGGGVSLGWFNLGTNFDKISQELIRKNIIEIHYEEGQGGEEFGRQLLETTKQVFEAINQQAVAGEGFFKFEPNPDPQQPPDGGKDWGASLLPWSVNVNTSYIAQSFNQEIKFEETVSFTGMLDIPVNTSMALAVGCSPETQKLFFNLQNNEYGCLTTRDKQGLQTRIGKERMAKEAKLQQYETALMNGQIDFQTYDKLVAVLNTRSLTEMPNVGATGVMSIEEATAELDALVEKHFGICL